MIVSTPLILLIYHLVVFVLFNDKGQVLKIRQLFPGVGNHLAVLDPEFADFLPPAVDRLLGDQVDEKVSQGRYQ